MSYLDFSKIEKLDRKTNLFLVQNLNNGISLGYIKFYPQWRKYVFEPNHELAVIFDASCLEEISNFLLKQTQEWQKENREREKGE